MRGLPGPESCMGDRNRRRRVPWPRSYTGSGTTNRVCTALHNPQLQGGRQGDRRGSRIAGALKHSALGTAGLDSTHKACLQRRPVIWNYRCWLRPSCTVLEANWCARLLTCCKTCRNRRTSSGGKKHLGCTAQCCIKQGRVRRAALHGRWRHCRGTEPSNKK